MWSLELFFLKWELDVGFGLSRFFVCVFFFNGGRAFWGLGEEHAFFKGETTIAKVVLCLNEFWGNICIYIYLFIQEKQVVCELSILCSFFRGLLQRCFFSLASSCLLWNVLIHIGPLNRFSYKPRWFWLHRVPRSIPSQCLGKKQCSNVVSCCWWKSPSSVVDRWLIPNTYQVYIPGTQKTLYFGRSTLQKEGRNFQSKQGAPLGFQDVPGMIYIPGWCRISAILDGMLINGRSIEGR